LQWQSQHSCRPHATSCRAVPAAETPGRVFQATVAATMQRVRQLLHGWQCILAPHGSGVWRSGCNAAVTTGCVGVVSGSPHKPQARACATIHARNVTCTMQWSRLATCMHPYCCVCRQVYYMVRSKQFDWAILVVILTNSALMAVTWYGAPEVLVSTLEYINKGYTFIYMIEAALKVRMWPAGQGGGAVHMLRCWQGCLRAQVCATIAFWPPGSGRNPQVAMSRYRYTCLQAKPDTCTNPCW
jgi:hypothetical protein